MTQKFDYYEVLEIQKTASQQQIKQAYRKLALIHHPDKNQGAEQSKLKFHRISEAYTVLNDPKKRQNYDQYGVADLEGMQFDFEDLFGNFGDFEQFLNEIIGSNSFDAMFSEINKSKNKSKKTRGRAKGRQKYSTTKEINQLSKLMGGMGGFGGLGDMGFAGMTEDQIQMAMIQMMMGGGIDMKQMEKELQKMVMESDDDQEQDQEDLTEQELKIFSFGQQNIEKKKVRKKKNKTQIFCKLDGQKIEQEQILMHFTEKHMNQFKEWEKGTIKLSSSEIKNNKKQEEEIEY